MDLVISTVIPLAALALAFVSYQLQSKQALKRLHYTANSHQFILWANQDFMLLTNQDVEVHISGRPLICPILHFLRLENTGDAPITTSDFAAPLKLHFGAHVQIIHCSVSWNRPGVLGTTQKCVTGYGGDIFIEPFLINPRDRIDIVAVVDGVPVEPSVQARIAGVEEVVFLPPFHPNINTELDVRSLLFETRAEWPPSSVPNPVIFVIPSLVDPAQYLHKKFDVLVSGKSTPDAHMFKIIFELPASVSKDAEKSLILEWPETSVSDVSGEIGDMELDALALSRFATWDEHQIAIDPAPLEAGENLVINVITSGPGHDLRATQLPRLISDIHVGRVILKDFIEDNLGKVEPRMLLSSHKAHTLWQKWWPGVERIKGAVRHIKELAESSQSRRD